MKKKHTHRFFLLTFMTPGQETKQVYSTALYPTLSSALLFKIIFS